MRVPPSTDAHQGTRPCHRVHRLELQIHTGDKRLAQALLPRLSRLHHDRLLPLLERICDGVSPDRRLHRLQTLEIDLGPLALERLDDQFAERLEQALREALVKRLQPTRAETPASPAESPATGGDAELIATFAATGNLPWWAPRDQPTLIADALARCWPASIEPILAALASQANALDRLRRAVHPDQRGLLEAAIAALPHVVLSPTETPAAGPPAGSDSQAAGSLPGAAQRFPSPGPAGSAAAAPPKQASPPPPLALALPTAQRLETPPADPPPPSAAAAAPHPLAPRRHGGVGEPWMIDGAGLVLLWPFLETFCRRLHLLGEDRQFRGEGERQRAIALFALLVDEAQELSEWHLTLAKVLGGVSPDSPWILEEPLAAEELRELQELLIAALTHAGDRLGEDPEALRRNFLQRPGLLTHQPSGWLLQVERQEGDGVLDDLPWSVQWLRLIWMAEGLQVSW
jgi:hypothetical protein